MHRNWMITGGCGFLGVNLVRRLLRAGPETRIVILDNLSVGARANLASVCQFDEGACRSNLSAAGGEPHRVRLVPGDILDAELVARVAAGADVIVHFAANAGVPLSLEEPRKDMLTNVVGTFNCLEAARANGVLRFVFASSGAPVGEIEPPIDERIAPRPVSPYGASKLAGEGYCSAYARSFGIDTVALRFGNVYGPRSGHKTSVVAKFIKKALDGETLSIFGDGRQTRDYVFVEDLIDAVVKAATVDGVGGELFQIATHRETTILELVDALSTALQEAGVARPEFVHDAPRVGDVMRNYSDTTKARERLGWRATTMLPDGLRQTIAAFLAQRQADRP